MKPEQDKLPGPVGTAPFTPQAMLTSAELMQGRREIVIVHRGEHYRLQQTRNGKLILTK